MAPYITTWSLTATWMLALTVALSLVAGTIPLAAWVTVALIGLMPPLMFMVFTHTSERATAEIIRDVEAGRVRSQRANNGSVAYPWRGPRASSGWRSLSS